MRAVLVQPKRLALLIYLTASHPGGFHRRDELLLLLWPELPDDRARNSLRQAVHQLRRSLEDDVVISRGADALGVDRSRLWCDAHEFEAALDRGALAEAAGSHLVWSARIAALLGERDTALGFLRSAFGRGYCHGVELHADVDFASLWGYPPFQQLMRPKG